MQVARWFRLIALAAVVAIAIGLGLSRVSAPASGEVSILELPRGGDLPFAVADGHGTLHVAFMVNQDVFYARYGSSGTRLGNEVQVNDRDGVAAGGMFRGPELALASDGSARIIWYRRGYELKLPRAEQGPMLSRRQANGSFGAASLLFDRPTDGHSLVSARDGLLAAWVADDSLWVSASVDAGATFQPAEDFGPLPCECCDTALATTNDGAAFLMYRDRTDNVRDVYLRQVRPIAATGRRLRLDSDEWRFDACPMSGMSLAAHDGGLYATWEHKGQILLSDIDTGRWSRRPPIVVSTSGRYPVVGSDGQSLIVAWKERKDLVWRLYDGKTLQFREGSRERSSSSNRPSVVAPPGGGYVLVP